MPNQKKKSAEQKNSNKNTIEVNNKTQEEVKEAEENNKKEKKEQITSPIKQEQKHEIEQKQNTKKKQQTTVKTSASKASKNKNSTSKADTANLKKQEVKENKKNSKQISSTENDEKEEVENKDEQNEISNKNEKKQLTKNEIKQMQETIEKEMKSNKQIPQAELNKINTRVFQNICLAIIMMFYFNFIILGFINIENAVFLVDLKVFSLVVLVIAIGTFEYAYKKDSGRHAIHGIEVLVIALITISLIYVNIMMADKFIPITVMITYIFAIYYIAKAIIIYKKMKKQYFINNMKEIIKNKKR